MTTITDTTPATEITETTDAAGRDPHITTTGRRSVVVRPGILPPAGPKVWVDACHVDRLVPGRGVAVLLPGARQAALFLQPTGMIYALDNLDPFSGAAVLSRGLTGDHGGEPTVASPLLKQLFSLRTGRCLDDDAVAVATYSVRVVDGVVRVGLTA